MLSYARSITPPDFTFRIEFNRDSSIDFQVSQKMDSVKKGSVNWFEEWNIDPHKYVAPPRSGYDIKYGAIQNSLGVALEKLNWTEKEIQNLGEYLKKAKCIGICVSSRRVEVEVSYTRNGMGLYSYDIYPHPLSDSVIAELTQSCSNRYLNDSVILKYQSGAIGSDCYP